MNNDLRQYERIPPQAPEVEEGVLGAMMFDEDARILGLDRLSVRDFYKPAHKHIFSAIQKLHQESVEVDLLSIEQELRDKQLLDMVGGPGVLAEISRSSAGATNIDYYCQILNEKTTLRETILKCGEVIKKAYDPDADPYDLLDHWKENLSNVENRSFLEIPLSASRELPKLLAETLEERNVKDGMIGVPAYLPVDRLTAGFGRKEIAIIAARPSMGKTGYMLTIVKNLLEAGFEKAIAIFSYEMDKDILLLRLLCMMGSVNMQFARRGKLNDEEKMRLVEAAKNIGFKGKWNPAKKIMEVQATEDCLLFIEDDNMTDIGRIEGKCRRIDREYGLGIVFIDYLQLIPVWDRKEKNIGTREQEVAYISRSLKNMAKELDVPVVPLSQLSRAVETRSGSNRPQLSDLRESGSMEQDASIVIFLYRPEYYNIKRTDEGVSTKGMCEVIVAKHRNGPTGTEKHEFIEEFAVFKEWDEQAAAMRSGSGDPQQQSWTLGVDDPGEYPDEVAPF